MLFAAFQSLSLDFGHYLQHLGTLASYLHVIWSICSFTYCIHTSILIILYTLYISLFTTTYKLPIHYSYTTYLLPARPPIYPLVTYTPIYYLHTTNTLFYCMLFALHVQTYLYTYLLPVYYHMLPLCCLFTIYILPMRNLYTTYILRIYTHYTVQTA